MAYNEKKNSCEPSNLPEINNPIIPRNNILHTFDEVLKGDTRILLLEGKDGIGKTTIIREYYQRHKNRAAAVFLSSICKWSRDYNIYVFELIKQIYYILNNQFINFGDIDESLNRKTLLAVSERYRYKSDKFLVMVDGIDDIPKDEMKSFLEFLPINQSGFKIVITGQELSLYDHLPFNKIKFKSHTLTGFTLGETKEYLEDLKLQEKIVTDIHNTCKGLPGYLSMFRHYLISSDSDIETVTTDLPSSMPGLFSLEWSQLDKHKNDENIYIVLALLAFDDKLYSMNELLRIFDINSSYNDLLKSLTFLTIDDNKKVSFRSESIKKYAARKLDSYKKSAYERLINFLLANPESEESIIEIPRYLFEAGKHDDLLDYLSKDKLLLISQYISSLREFKQYTLNGLHAAERLNKDIVMVSHAFTCSAIESMNNTRIWNFEIDALISLNEFDKAISIANNATLLEDRLHAYAIILRGMISKNLSINEEISEQIDDIYTKIKPSSLGDRAIDIASDLIYSKPEKALDLVKQSLNVTDDPNAIDIAFLKLTIATINKYDKDNQIDSIWCLQDIFTDKHLNDFPLGFGILKSDMKYSELIKTIDNISDVSTKIQFLSKWTRNNRKKLEAIKVTLYGVKGIIKTTEYSPNARVFYNLCTPTEFIQSCNTLKEVLNIIQGQLPNLKNIGPEEEYYKLRILYVIGSSRYNKSISYEELISIYYNLHDIKDLITKANVMCNMLNAINKINFDDYMENKEGLHSLIKKDFDNIISKLLIETAEHYESFKSIVNVLSYFDIDYAIKIVNKVNTAERRDHLYKICMSNLITGSGNIVNIGNQYLYLYDMISDCEVKQDIIIDTLQYITTENPVNIGYELRNIFTSIDDFYDSYAKCKALTYYIIYQYQHNETYLKNTSEIIKELSKVWEGLDNSQSKIKLGFQIVKILANSSSSLANEFLILTEQDRSETSIDSIQVNELLFYSTLISIRAYNGLIMANCDTNQNLKEIMSLIQKIPSVIDQGNLYTDVLVKAYISGRFDIVRKVASEKIVPMLSNYHNEVNYTNILKLHMMPAIYFYNQDIAKEQLNSLPMKYKERAITNIIQCIVSKKSLFEPVNNDYISKYVNYGDIVNIIELLSLIATDYIIYDIISTIVETVRINKYSFSKEQTLNIASKLDKVIEIQLPWDNGIKHDGYKIVSKAQLLSIADYKNKDKWKALLNETASVNNSADKAFILSVLYCCMPPKLRQENESIKNEIINIIDHIPTSIEKISIYLHLFNCMKDKLTKQSKNILKKAFSISIKDEECDSNYLPRKIIDLAHRIDPDFAASLVSLSDKDSARKHIKQGVIRQNQILQLQKKIIKSPTYSLEDKNIDKDLPDVSWKMLTSLNSDRIKRPLNLKDTRNALFSSSKMSINKSYPILSWLTENAINKFQRSNNQAKYLKDLFGGMISSTYIISSLAPRTSPRRDKNRKPLSIIEDSDILDVGDDKKYKVIMREWIIDNCVEELIICDQYFTTEELWMLNYVLEAEEELNVIIVTSKINNKSNYALKDMYLSKWRQLSDDEPPPTDIIVLALEPKGDSPIHDRWLISKNAALRLGTSIKTKVNKVTELSEIDPSRIGSIKNTIYKYISLDAPKMINGKRLRKESFTL